MNPAVDTVHSMMGTMLSGPVAVVAALILGLMIGLASGFALGRYHAKWGGSI